MTYARKRFGQHFLQDTHVIQKIVDSIATQPHIVEIGPGRGALTSLLLQQTDLLDIIELDRDLVATLALFAKKHKQLRIHQADILQFDLNQLLLNEQELLCIVGNLPYNISTPLLFYLLNYLKNIGKLVFMLQREVVDRLIATPNTAEYGRLSVMLQYYFQMNKLFDVPPDAFDPPPKVYSSVIECFPHDSLPVTLTDVSTFSLVVAQGFSQRRKTLRNNLKGLLTDVDMEKLGINPQRRAETLSLQEFAILANYIAAT